MKTAVQQYAEYLSQCHQRQHKDWALVEDLSLNEMLVRHQYLGGESEVVPLRGTGVEYFKDDPELQAIQQRFNKLLMQYSLLQDMPDQAPFLALFRDVLTLHEGLLWSEQAQQKRRLREEFASVLDMLLSDLFIKAYHQLEQSLRAPMLQALYLSIQSGVEVEITLDDRPAMESLDLLFAAVTPLLAEKVCFERYRLITKRHVPWYKRLWAFIY